MTKFWGRVLVNSITLSRLLLVPVFLYLDRKGAFFACLLTMLGINLSDILDGFTARKFKCQTGAGAVFDAAADFAVLFTLYIFYCISGIYPLFLIFLMVLSFGLFLFLAFINKAIVKSRFGKYTGAVLYSAVTLSITARAFLPHFWAAANGIAVVLSIITLAVSIIENLILLYRHRLFNDRTFLQNKQRKSKTRSLSL